MIKQILIMLLLAVSGCTSLNNDAIIKSKEVTTTQSDFSFDEHLKSTDPYIAPEQPKTEEAIDNKTPSSKPAIYQGSDKQVKLPSSIKPVNILGNEVTLNFEQAPLIDVVHAIMGDILELDYIIEHPITGEVTLRTNKAVPSEQLLTILETLLQSNNALMLRDKDNRFVISGSIAAVKLRPQLSGPYSKGAGYSTMIIPLQYIGADEMANILKPLATETAFLRIDPPRNLLIMAGTRTQLDGWLNIVATFDIDTLKGMSIGIFPLENTTTSEMKDMLSGVLGNAGTSGTEPASNLSKLVKIMPIERLNSLIIVTPRAHYLKQVKLWIERLDQATDSKHDRHLFVYSVQNSSAVHIAELLTKIFSGTASRSNVTRAPSVAPGLTPVTITNDGSTTPSTSAPSPSRPSSSSTTIGSVKIVADDENNALLIYATKSEYRDIERALKKLDIQAAQVLIEASILEVSLTDGLEYGVEWFVKNGLSGDKTGTLRLVNSGVDVAPVVPGFSYQIADAVGDLNVVLNALAEDSLINVISTPSILVLDNNTAKIQVGNQQPVQDSQTVTEGGVITQSISFKDTGVALTVTPSINAGGMVTMDIIQSVTDVGNIDAATGQRSFLTRDIESKVAVRSGESIVLGGLIRDNKSLSNSGVPVLKDIPWLGNLFSKTKEKNDRVELMVIITPRVIYNEQDLRDVSREMRSQLRGLLLFNEPSDQNAEFE